MKILVYVIFLIYPVFAFSNKENLNVKYLQPGSIIHYTSDQRIGFFSTDLRIYCYNGSPKCLSCLFQTINLEVDINSDDFVQYEGATPEIVQIHYKNQRSIFSFNLLNTNKQKLIKINPFNQTCVGIETPHPYKVQLNLIRIDFWKVIILGIGLFAFVSSSRLSETPVFYYLSGICLGIFASFLVVVYFISKLFPRKPMMYTAMVGGWTLSIYFTQLIWENVQMILITYQSYVFWYVIITGCISFVICYRFGPPKNQRSKNLIKWGLQLAALIMIFFSSHFQEATVGIIIVTVLSYYFPKNWIIMSKKLWLKKFPPKRRLLTNEEYYEQTVQETTLALSELKNYCSSPESQPWRVMMKLKDPQRFASFMEGSPHLLDSEILEYEISRVDNSDSDISLSEDDEQPVTSNHNGLVQSRPTPLTRYTSTPNNNSVRNYKQYARVEFSEDDE